MPRSLALSLVVATQIACQRTSPSRPLTPNVVEAGGGDITITPFMHASVQIEHAGSVIQVDPAMGDITTAKPADLVLVTDLHDDHMNPSRIRKVRKPGAPVVMPAAVRDQAGQRIPAPFEVLANGETRTVAGIAIEAVPMYNLKSEVAGGEPFHTRGRGNGYVITVGGKRLYVAGDTECVPEIKALKNIDVAFLPMNLPFTMPMIASQPAQMAEILEGTRVTMVALHQASANGARPLGRRPLVVLTAENGRDPRFTALEAKLTHLSANSSQRIVAGSGPEIHLFEPGAVVHAIQDVVRAVRSGSRVPAR